MFACGSGFCATWLLSCMFLIIVVKSMSGLKDNKFRNWCKKSLLNWVPCVLKMCSRDSMPWVVACLYSNVPYVLTCSCTSLMCLHADVPMCLVCSRAHLQTYFACSGAEVATCLEIRFFSSVEGCIRKVENVWFEKIWKIYNVIGIEVITRFFCLAFLFSPVLMQHHLYFSHTSRV